MLVRKVRKVVKLSEDPGRVGLASSRLSVHQGEEDQSFLCPFEFLGPCASPYTNV